METAAATAVTLPDDVVREILVRVADPYALFRCAMTCKRWHALVADPSFLRRCWPENAPYSSTLAGFFAPQSKGTGEPVLVPAHRSPISTSRRFLSSFCLQAAGFLRNAVPLTSRRGLLLVLIRQQGTYDDLPKQLAVCDILAGTCVMLPPLYPNVSFSFSSHTIVTAADCSCSNGKNRPPSPENSSAFFRVLIVGQNYDGVTYRYYLTMFSSDESSWTAPRECLNHADMRKGYRRGAVVCQGIAHWLFKCGADCYTLNVSADTGHVSSTKLLVRSSPCDALELQLIIAVDGALCLLHMLPNGNRIRIWTRQEGESRDDDAKEWLCTRVIKLKRPRSKLNWASSICVGEQSGMLLFWDPFLYVANLETGTTESVHQLFEGLLAGSALPLVLDWPSLFMSRLGQSKEDTGVTNLSTP